MNKHIIEGREVRVWARGIPKHLWLSVEFVIEVSEGETFRSPDKLEGLSSVVPFGLGENSASYELRSKKPASLLISRYAILQNGQEIAKGSVRATNWYMIYGLFVVMASSLYVYGSTT